MNAPWANLRRLWRVAHPGRDSLARSSDRVEAVTLLFALSVAMIALPVSASVGSDTYASQKAQSIEQTSTRHPGTATLLADGPPIEIGSRGAVTDRPAPTDATWMLPDGSVHTGKVMAGQGTVKDATVSIWLDQYGNPVDPPLSAAAAVIDSLAVGLALWLSVCGLLGLFYWVVRAVLDRVRYARWQDEWSRIEERRSHP